MLQKKLSSIRKRGGSISENSDLGKPLSGHSHLFSSEQLSWPNAFSQVTEVPKLNGDTEKSLITDSVVNRFRDSISSKCSYEGGTSGWRCGPEILVLNKDSEKCQIKEQTKSQENLSILDKMLFLLKWPELGLERKVMERVALKEQVMLPVPS